MSSETRVVRPYVGGEAIQKALDGCRLRCADVTVDGGVDVSVTLDEYLNHPFALLLDDVDWTLALSGVSDLELEPSDLDLVVLATAPRLRFADPIFRRGLSATSALPSEISLSQPERPRSLRAPHGGTDLGVYVCLNKSLPPRPLAPWRKGTWLGRQEFRIRSALSGNGFVPIRMSDEDREHLSLPKDTSRFATLEDGDPFDTDPGAEAVRLYVDGELLDRLAVSTTTPVGKHIQRQLFLDAAAAIVFSVHRRIAEDDALAGQHIDDFRGSLAHKLTELIVGRGLDTASQELRQREYRRLQESPTAFLAHVEAKIGMRRDMIASFGENR